MLQTPRMLSPLDVFRPDALAGHVALVTGGGTGICRGIAHAYARFGADVCIVSRKPDVIARTADELSAATGRAVLGLPGDVRDPDALARVVTATIAKFGKLDTLVNGAAGNFLVPAAGLSPNGFKTVIDIDLGGTFNASRAAFDALRTSGNGLVLEHQRDAALSRHAAADPRVGREGRRRRDHAQPRRRVGPVRDPRVRHRPRADR